MKKWADRAFTVAIYVMAAVTITLWAALMLFTSYIIYFIWVH